MLALGGFDFFVVDNEHSQMSKESMLDLVRTADISGIVSSDQAMLIATGRRLTADLAKHR